MAIQIDLLSLTPETQALLWRLVHQNPTQKVWRSHVGLKVQMPDGSEETVILSHPLMKRARKEGKDDSPRFEVLSKKHFGAGGIGRVYRSLATLIPTPATQTFEYSRGQVYLEGRRTRRAVKIVRAPHPSQVDKLQKMTAREAETMAHVDHLKSKPMVAIADSESGITMKFLAGEPLYDFLTKERRGERDLSIEDRFELSIAFFEALIEQVIDKGMLHKDIKPENAMVSRKNGQFKVKILDYGMARNKDDPTLNVTERKSGTPGYIPPEADNADIPFTSAFDVFSSGVSVAYIWRDNETRTVTPNIRISKGFNYLFFHMSEFSKTPMASKIRDLLKNTIIADPNDRISAQDALAQFRSLYVEYKAEKAAALLEKYREQITALKKYIEEFDWELTKVQRRPIFIMTEQGKKRVPFHVAPIWEKLDSALKNPEASLADFQKLESDILALGKKASYERSFFRKPSTQTFYTAHHAESLSDVLKALNIDVKPLPYHF